MWDNTEHKQSILKQTPDKTIVQRFNPTSLQMIPAAAPSLDNRGRCLDVTEFVIPYRVC